MHIHTSSSNFRMNAKAVLELFLKIEIYENKETIKKVPNGVMYNERHVPYSNIVWNSNFHV